MERRTRVNFNLSNLNPPSDDESGESQSPSPKRVRRESDEDYVPPIGESTATRNANNELMPTIQSASSAPENNSSNNEALKMSEWPITLLHFCRNSLGSENARIIVPVRPEPLNNNSLCFEYALLQNRRWYCLGCNVGKAGKKHYGDLKNEKFTSTEIHQCTPITFEEARKKQDYIVSKMALSSASEDGQSSSQSVPHQIVASSPQQTLSSNIDATLEQKEEAKAAFSDASLNSSSSSLSFVVPSSTWFKEACTKIKCNYDPSVYNLWATMVIDYISTTSKPHKVKYIGGGSFFDTISYLITGKLNEEAKPAIIGHFINNYKILKTFDGVDFENMSLADATDLALKKEMKPYYFEFLSQWINCRIGIFDDDNFHKYGDWSPDDTKVTLLLLYEQGEYQVVITLKQ